MHNDSHRIMEAFTHFGQRNTSHEPAAAEDEQQRLDAHCWKGYHKQGTKIKGNTRVNNCVKSEEEMMPAPTFYDLLRRMQSNKKHVPAHDKHMHDLTKQDSREQYSDADHVKHMQAHAEDDEQADEPGELMRLMKLKGMIDQQAGAGTGGCGCRREEEESDAPALRDIVAKLLHISQQMWKQMDMEDFYSAQDLALIKSHAESILRRVKDVAEQKSQVTSVSHRGYGDILRTFK